MPVLLRFCTASTHCSRSCLCGKCLLRSDYSPPHSPSYHLTPVVKQSYKNVGVIFPVRNGPKKGMLDASTRKFENKRHAEMAKRPYFKFGIDELEEQYQQSKGDEALLKSLAAELMYRDRPKAKALQREVAQCLAALSSSGKTESVKPPHPPTNPPAFEKQEYLSRISVECGKCGMTNFVSTLENVTQHLSCSSCKTSYEAVFKYGVLRSKFDTSPEKFAFSRSTVVWIVLIAITVIIAFFVAK